MDSCSPQNWGARGAKFNIKKLFRYPLRTVREQGAGSREQGAGSREQGAGGEGFIFL